MQQAKFSGVLTAIATPFLQTGEIDLPSFKRLVRYLKDAGTHGVVVAGTTGESPNLTFAEKEVLVSAALEERSETFHIYVGTGTNSTAETVELSKHFAHYSITNAGLCQAVDGVMAVVPYYNKPTQEGLLQHYAAVAKAIGNKPLCLYNVPGRTGVSLTPESALRLFQEHENIVAIKEAAGNVNVIAELALGVAGCGFGSTRRSVQILSGDDATFAPALLAGATGIISVASHLIPRAFVDMFAAARAGDFSNLQRLHLATYALNRDLFCAPNPVALKWALARKGLCLNVLRLPLTPLNENLQSLLASALEQVSRAGIEI